MPVGLTGTVRRELLTKYGKKGLIFMPFVIILGILSLLVALFAVQNAVSVSLNFLAFTFESSLVLVILGSFVAGLLVAAMFMLAMKARHFLAERRLNDEKQRLEAELARQKERVLRLEGENNRLTAELEKQKSAAQAAEAKEA